MLFGPSRQTVWKQLAAELGGSYQHSFWRGSQVHAEANGWTVLLDIRLVPIGKVVIPFTRARARFTTLDHLRFRLYRETLLSELGKLLGMQDILIGDAQFDDTFIVKSNDPSRIKELLSDAELRELLLSQSGRFDLQVNDRTSFAVSLPEGIFELQYQVMGTVKNLDQLRGIYEVFGQTLERLTVIRSAGPPGPEASSG